MGCHNELLHWVMETLVTPLLLMHYYSVLLLVLNLYQLPLASLSSNPSLQLINTSKIYHYS